MEANLIIRRHSEGRLKGKIDDWWVEDKKGNRWEIFTDDLPYFSVQYDNGENCGTGRFVLEPGQDLAHGSELSGVIYETPVGELGVPCELEFPSVSTHESEGDDRLVKQS
jgi:hypothetical protein